MKQSTWKRALLYLPFAAALVMFAVLYSNTFPYADDLRFSIWGGSLGRIWNSYLDYYTYGGARMGNVLAQLFLMAGFNVWRLVSPVAVVLTGLLLYYYVTGTCHAKGGAPTAREMAMACLCAFFPGLIPISTYTFAESFLWLDGSCNYIYPLLCTLVGFLPFYNTLRERPLPRPFRLLSPIFLIAASMLHEQAAMLLAAMCVLTLLYLRRDRKITSYLAVLTILTLAALAVMLTAPGAYARIGKENGQLTGAATYWQNILHYFAPLNDGSWPLMAGLGLISLWLLHRRGTRGFVIRLLQVILAAGIGLGPLSSMLNLPIISTGTSQTPFQQAAGNLLCVFWISFILAALGSMLYCAHGTEGRAIRYLPVLGVGMWASQAIPALATHASGRAKLYLAVFLLLAAFCALWTEAQEKRRFPTAQLALSIVAVLSLCMSIRGMQINKIAYDDIEAQIASAKAGVSDHININFTRFDNQYINSTFVLVHYEEWIRKYYGIPDHVKFVFISK